MENIKLKGSKNIRDLGGLKTENGEVKEKAFLRGSHLHNITDKDAKKLVEEYDLSAILDLRSSREVIEKNDVSIDDVRYKHFPVFGGAVKGITHESSTDNAQSSDKSPSLSRLYKRMVGESCMDNMKRIFTYILNRKSSDGALLIHCSEGKDRTGVVTMILLSLLGVPFESVMEDYLFTNTINEKKAKKFYFLARLANRDKEYADELHDIYLAKEEYLQAAYDAVLESWGSVENYVNKGLGIDMEVIESFRKEFVV